MCWTTVQGRECKGSRRKERDGVLARRRALTLPIVFPGVEPATEQLLGPLRFLNLDDPWGGETIKMARPFL